MSRFNPELVAALRERWSHLQDHAERLEKKFETTPMGTNERLMMGRYRQLASAYAEVIGDATGVNTIS